MNYKQKYLKYKSKFFKLKNQNGGSNIYILTWNIWYKIDNNFDKTQYYRMDNVIKTLKKTKNYDFYLFQENNLYNEIKSKVPYLYNYRVINYSKKPTLNLKTLITEKPNTLNNSLTIFYNKKYNLLNSFGGYLYDDLKLSNGRGYVCGIFNKLDNPDYIYCIISIHQGHKKGNNFNKSIYKIQQDKQILYPRYKFNRIIIGGDYNNNNLLDQNYTIFNKRLYNVPKSKINPTCCIPNKIKFTQKIDYIFDSERIDTNSRYDYKIKSTDLDYNSSDHKPVIYKLRS